MARYERKHEVLTDRLTDDLLRERAADGWKPVAIVWEREGDEEAPAPEPEPVPYGLRVSADCRHLEQDDGEVETMITMLKMIVDEKPFSEVARSLNERGMRTRQGTEWNQTAVFYMLPRLIEVAPEIYSSRAWQELKPHLVATV